MTITPKILVQREVFYCVSHLVSQLAMGYGAISTNTDMGKSLAEVTEQAMELASPIDDWEEAARQEGWYEAFGGGVARDVADYETMPDDAENWQDACEQCGIEPYQREVFEHWIVSDWLADKLAERGEKVDKDFAGMTIWARTTTGQAIAMDSVIEAICADLVGNDD